MTEAFAAIQPPEIGAMPRWARTLIGRANRITPKPGFTDEDLLAVWERSEGRCAVSGLPFSEEIVGTGKAKKPFAPSLDRIDRHRGYTRKNTRLVCVIANFAMNAWGEEPLLTLAIAMADSARSEAEDPDHALWYARQDARIAEAERLSKQFEGEALRRHRGRIAALKRARTLGPAGLTAAAERAWRRRGR